MDIAEEVIVQMKKECEDDIEEVQADRIRRNVNNIDSPYHYLRCVLNDREQCYRMKLNWLNEVLYRIEDRKSGITREN